MNYKRIVLRQDANYYIKDLLNSGNTLAKLLGCKNIETGSVETCLPNYAEMEHLYDFEISVIPTPNSYSYTERGKKYSLSKVRTFYSCAVDTIQNHLRTNSHNLCICDANNLTPNSKHVNNKLAVTYRDEVYYFLHGEMTNETILETIKQASGWYDLYVLSFVAKSDEILTKHTLSQDELKILAQNTSKLIVGAYDGDSFLIWNKRELDGLIES